MHKSNPANDHGRPFLIAALDLRTVLGFNVSRIPLSLPSSLPPGSFTTSCFCSLSPLLLLFPHSPPHCHCSFLLHFDVITIFFPEEAAVQKFLHVIDDVVIRYTNIPSLPLSSPLPLSPSRPFPLPSLPSPCLLILSSPKRTVRTIGLSLQTA